MSRRYDSEEEVEQETVPCDICGRQSTMIYTKLCGNCWELERRLPVVEGDVLELLGKVFNYQRNRRRGI